MTKLDQLERWTEVQKTLKAEVTTIGPPYGSYLISDINALIKVARAAEKRVLIGHDSYCKGFNIESKCDCGHAELSCALLKLYIYISEAIK